MSACRAARSTACAFASTASTKIPYQWNGCLNSSRAWTTTANSCPRVIVVGSNMPEPRNKRRRIAVHNSPIHGRGVFALRRIPRGVRIIEYKGKLITDKEADRRYSRMHANSPHTMLFSLDGGLVIDATRRGNSARWINHSCAPNCEIEEEGHRIFIDARRDILAGEE